MARTPGRPAALAALLLKLFEFGSRRTASLEAV